MVTALYIKSHGLTHTSSQEGVTKIRIAFLPETINTQAKTMDVRYKGQRSLRNRRWVGWALWWLQLPALRKFSGCSVVGGQTGRAWQTPSWGGKAECSGKLRSLRSITQYWRGLSCTERKLVICRKFPPVFMGVRTSIQVWRKYPSLGKELSHRSISNTTQHSRKTRNGICYHWPDWKTS